MVRLKENKRLPKVEGLPEFQFHYGTIKSAMNEGAYMLSEDFNSTMVRLKDCSNANQT